MDDGFITADFIGGVWNGKTHDIPFVPEWKVAILPVPKYRFINKPPDELLKYDVAVYRYIGHGLYWFSRLEKAE